MRINATPSDLPFKSTGLATYPEPPQFGQLSGSTLSPPRVVRIVSDLGKSFANDYFSLRIPNKLPDSDAETAACYRGATLSDSKTQGLPGLTNSDADCRQRTGNPRNENSRIPTMVKVRDRQSRRSLLVDSIDRTLKKDARLRRVGAGPRRMKGMSPGLLRMCPA